MRYAKNLAMALAVVLSVGAVAAGSASAETGTVLFNADRINTCSIDFDWNPATGDVTNIVEDDTDCYLQYQSYQIPFDLSQSELSLTFDDTDYMASFAGTFVFEFGFFECVYDTSSLGPVTGSYADSAPGVWYFGAGEQDVAKVSGNVAVCPSPLQDLQFWNGDIYF